MSNGYPYRQQQAMFIVSASHEKVRISESCELGGFSNLPRYFRTVRDEIELNLLVVRDGEVVLAFLAVDVLFAGRELTEFATVVLRRLFGARAEMIVAASHTHNAPMIDKSKPLLGSTSQVVLELIKEAIERLFERARKAETQIDETTEVVANGQHGVNRRLTSNLRLARNGFAKRKRTFMAPNQSGAVDNSIRCQLLHSKTGDVLAALLQVACHPTSYPDRFAVTAEYVAKLRGVIRELHGSNVTVIFLQGFCGDVRSSCEGPLTAKLAARRLVYGPGFRQPSMTNWEAWSDAMSANLKSALLNHKQRQPLKGRLSIEWTRFPVNELIAGYAGDANFERAHFVFGSAFTGVAVNAEMLTGWLKYVEGHFFTAGCINDTFGYLPDPASVEHGGYEVHGFMRPFGLQPSGWRQGFEEQVTNALSTMARV
jgi:neutral ceramidase